MADVVVRLKTRCRARPHSAGRSRSVAQEEGIIQQLMAFPGVVKEAGLRFSPALIANYTYDLTKEYNQFYHDYSILKEDDPKKRTLRLVLSVSVAHVVSTAMRLLGIEVPERM